MRDGAILHTDQVRARDSGGLWLYNQNNATGMQLKSNGDIWMTGNASIDGNLVVGGTGAFGNSVTITADVQVAAGQKFYMDGGSDTYWTASNDIITGHVNSASVVHFKAAMQHITTSASVDVDLYVGGDLHVLGSLNVHASTLYLGDNQFGNAQTDTQTLYGNVIVYNDAAANPMRVTGNASISGTGYVAGTFGVGGAFTAGNASHVIDGDLRFPLNSMVTIGSSAPHPTRPLYVYDDGADAVALLHCGDKNVALALRDSGTSSEYANQLRVVGDTMQMVTGGDPMLSAQQNGVVIGSAIATPGTNRQLHVTSKGTYARLQITDSTTGHTSGDGVEIGPQGTSYAALYSYDAPWSITSEGAHSATLASTNMTLANGMHLAVDEVRARDSGGLMLYEDSGAAGIQIADGGVTTFTHGLVANSTASVGGTLKVYGIMTAKAGVVHDTTLTQTGILTANANVVVNATVLASAVIIGGAGKARLVNCSINASGDITADGGTDLMLNQHDDTSPNQEFIAEKVWNAVYNDVVDWQDLREGEQVTYGKVYADSYDGAYLPTGRCAKGVMGICSDTFGFAVGRIQGRAQIPVSVAGWCLAYVDQAYETGEPLTNTSSGCLTSMNASEKALYPERLVALYKRPEHEEVWQGKVEVKGRHWVQVK
jgi:hypothetical protein